MEEKSEGWVFVKREFQRMAGSGERHSRRLDLSTRLPHWNAVGCPLGYAQAGTVLFLTFIVRLKPGQQGSTGRLIE